MDIMLENSTAPRGKSGTLVQSGVIGDEYIASLTGREACIVYSKMEKSDYQVEKVLNAIYNPILAASATVEPASQDAADIQAAKVIEKILLKDLNLSNKLPEILTFISRGFSVFEIVTMNKVDKELGPYTGLAQLGFRDQSSLDKWIFESTTGILTGIEQKQGGDLEVDTVLDAKFLIIFFNKKKGDDNGKPLLRPLYGPWKRKQLIEEMKMIGIERSAIMVPTMQVPKAVKPTDKEYTNAVELLQGYTSGENAFVMYPEGWNLKLESMVFDPTKLEATIKSEDEKMAGSVLAMFIELGTGGNAGALALSENLEKFFSNGIKSYAKHVTDTINERLIPFLCTLNFGDTLTKFPELKLAGIGESAGSALATVLSSLKGSSLLSYDVGLEDHIRKLYNLPKLPEEIVANGGPIVENTDPNADPDADDPADGDKPAKPAAGNESKPAPSAALNEPASSIRLAEKKPAALITDAAEEIAEVMRDKLTFIKEKMIADIIRYYKNLPEGKKLNAIKSVNIGGTARYKTELKAVLARVAAEALKKARLEVPDRSKVKLKDNAEAVKMLTEYASLNGRVIKLDDYSKLPRHVQQLLSLQTDYIVEKTVRDLEDRVAFQFMSSQASTDSAELIAQDLGAAADKIIEAGVIDTGAVNVASSLVNESRNAFFFDDEVLQDIAAMRFENADPVSAICQKLAGSVFLPTDAEFMRYSPPLHHNCKSYLTVVLKTVKNPPEITGLPALTEAEKKSITLSDKGLVNIVKLVENIFKGCSHAH